MKQLMTGGKNVLTPDIKNVFERSGMKLFVDVFGGSGYFSGLSPSS